MYCSWENTRQVISPGEMTCPKDMPSPVESSRCDDDGGVWMELPDAKGTIMVLYRAGASEYLKGTYSIVWSMAIQVIKQSNGTRVTHDISQISV